MLYDEARMALTKERLGELRREKKLSFEQLSKRLAERGVNISHTNLRNYEIDHPAHPLYGRTKSMSIEYLAAFADFYEVSVEYLLGLSNSRRREYHDVSEQLGLCDEAIARLAQCKERRGPYAAQDTAVLDDFLTSAEFDEVMEKIRQSLLSYRLYEQSGGASSPKRREQNADKLEEARRLMNQYGYFPVENDLVSQVCMENAIGTLSAYLRGLPKRLCEKRLPGGESQALTPGRERGPN